MVGPTTASRSAKSSRRYLAGDRAAERLRHLPELCDLADAGLLNDEADVTVLFAGISWRDAVAVAGRHRTVARNMPLPTWTGWAE